MNVNNERIKADYEKIYSQDVVKVVDDSLSEMDANFRNETQAKDIMDKQYLCLFSKTFRKYRRRLKDIVYGNNEHGLLNPTKLASVLCHTLIDCKPIKFTSDKAEFLINKSLESNDKIWLVNNVLINYKIAILSSLRLIYEDILASYKPAKGTEILNHGHLANYELYDNMSIQSNLIINLARNELLGQDFDELNYALIMFQWREYTIKQFALKADNDK